MDKAFVWQHERKELKERIAALEAELKKCNDALLAAMDTAQYAGLKSADLEAENEKLRTACRATMEAFDGIYGGDYGEALPIETMTPDRQAACNKALELVGRALEN